VKWPKAGCIAAATSNSVILIANFAHAVIGAVAVQLTCTQEPAVSMKSHAAKALGFLLDID
jgi:hypothetical protein